MDKITFRPWFYKIAPLLIWIILMVMPLFPGPGNLPPAMRQHFLAHMLSSNVMLLALFYIHTYLVYPLLNKRKGPLIYLSALSILLVIYALVYLLLHSLFPPPAHFGGVPGGQPGLQPANHIQGHAFDNKPRFGFFSIFSPLVALLCSFCYRVILDQAKRNALIKEREMVHLRTELNFLRSQISPHFLFNVLNSMVALVRRKSDQLEPVIIQLSHLMRYMLYEADDQPVPLEKEIAYLQNYIKLQSLRFGANVKVKTKFSKTDDNYMIAPMLLIPFVENAFKHGTGMMDQPVILIDLETKELSSDICFRVVNEINPTDISRDEQSGIGLTNVKRRLELLYPERHRLMIAQSEHAFIAELTIKGCQY